MRTADLIARLSADLAPVSPGTARRRLAAPVLAGLAVTVVLVLTWLGLRRLDEAVLTAAFWMKAAYTGLLAVAGASLAIRAARPGAKAGFAPWLALAAVVVMAGLSSREFLAATSGARLALWLGGSWNVCPFRIMALALPVYVGTVLGMRRLAPTRPMLAGAAAGFLAGALGACAYELFCPETGAMFVTTWYSLGILGATAAGALLGPALLRWRPA